GAYRLAGSCGREDRKFERPGCDASLLAQRTQEGRQLAVGQCSVVLDLPHLATGGQQVVEMPFPARRVFTGAIASHLCPLKHRLDTATHTGGRFWFCRPDRL